MLKNGSDVREHVQNSWKELCGFIESNLSVIERREDRASYKDFCALVLGIDRKTFDRWYEKREISSHGFNNRRDTLEKVVQLQKSLHQFTDPYWLVAAGVGKSLGLRGVDFGDGSTVAKYAGNYTCYRLGNDGLISGRISITNDNGDSPWMHAHTASVDGVDYSHRGPVFSVVERLYMLGVGVGDDGSSYFRPMIFKVHQFPKKKVTFGILLTEHYLDFMPMAGKVCLVSDEDPRASDEGFLGELKERLKIDSESHMIYARDHHI